MEKENGETSSITDGIGGSSSSSKGETSSLLDAASLFGAYWGRDASSQAAAASLLGGGAAYSGSGSGAMSGFGLLGSGSTAASSNSARYPPTSTLSVAASQAASLGLHPAASAAWWSMASQLAAQDYLARLQASGLASFPPDPYTAALGALGGAANNANIRGSSSRTSRAPRTPSHRSQKEKNSSSISSSSQGQSSSQSSLRSSYSLPKTSSPSLSSSQNLSTSSGLSALELSSLASSHRKASSHPSSSSKHSRKSSSSAAAKVSALSGAYLAQSGGNLSKGTNSSSSLKDKELALLRGDLIMAQAAMAQNAYQAAVVAASHKGAKNSSLFNNPFGLTSTCGSGISDKDRHSGLDSLSNLPHTILSDNTSILGGVRLPPDTEIIKYTSSIVGPKIPGTTNRGRKKTISLDPPHVSVLPALSSGLLNERGGPAKRPKLDSDFGNLAAAHQNSLNSNASASDRVEVIKLPSSSNSSQSSSFNMSNYTGLSKELLQSIANQSGLNLAALEKQFAEQFGSSSVHKSSMLGAYSSSSLNTSQDIGLNLSSKTSPPLPTNINRDNSPASTNNDEDAPLNLSLKSTASCNSDWKSTGRQSKTPDEGINSLHSLSSITANLGSKSVPPPPERVSRRKPGAKPRRVIQDTVVQPSVSPQRNLSPSLGLHRDTSGNMIALSHFIGNSESPGPKSSGSEDNDVGPWHSNKEGRPRNLGRGVSKPKKNTVASLLAQSRALGIRPALAHQYLQEAADLLNPELQEKLKAAINDPSSVVDMSESESEGPWESCPSDSEGDAFSTHARRLSDHPHLRIPLTMGWNRETLIKGLSRNGSIKGDVVYYPPEPHSSVKIRNSQDLTVFLEKNPSPPLTKENFSFSSRPLVGVFLQTSPSFGISNVESEYVKMSESEVAKRLDEARRTLSGLAGTTLAVEQRIELARQQQAAREARKDAVKGREQARLAKEQERSEKAEQAKRDREVRNQQLLEDKNWFSPTFEPKCKNMTRDDEHIQNTSNNTTLFNSNMHSTDLSLNSVSASKPYFTEKNSLCDEYNALDKIVSFAQSAAINLVASQSMNEIKCLNPDFMNNKLLNVNFTSNKNLKKALSYGNRNKDNKMEEYASIAKIINSYSRINEFMTNYSQIYLNNKNSKHGKDFKNSFGLIELKEIEEQYLKAKNEYMLQNLKLIPNRKRAKKAKEKNNSIANINLIEDFIADKKFSTHGSKISNHSSINPNIENKLTKSAKKLNKEDYILARRKRQEELEKQRHEDQTRKQQERELKRQQNVMIKEQMYIAEMNKQREVMFTVELERERRRQHMALVKQLDNRRRFEDREQRKHRILLDKLLLKERRLEERKKELELLVEIRKPQEDSTISDQKPLPTYNRIPGLKLPGQAMSDILMVFEFLHNFGQTLGFDMDTLPSLNTLQMALLPDCCTDAEDELISVMTHLLACAIEDPGIPHPGRHTTILGQTLRTNEITPGNISELLRIYLYASATGEVKALTGINPERDREKRVADHHQSDTDALQQSCHGRNLQYYRHLHSRPSWKLAERLKYKPYVALDPTTKANILARICDNLLNSKQILKQIDASLDNLTQLRKERYMMETKLRKLKMLHSRRLRMENVEKQQAIALERMQRMVEESEIVQQKDRSFGDKDNDILNLDMAESKPENIYDKKPLDELNIENSEADDANDKHSNENNHSDIASLDLQNESVLINSSSYLKDIMKDKDKDNLVKSNGISGPISKDLHLTDKDSIIGDSELILSDVESEGTQPEEDEDKNLTSEELSKKLEKFVKQSEAQLQSLIYGSHSLRANCFGQDRYWRRYWSLSKCGGIYVEAMESAQPEIMEYHEHVEAAAKRKEDDETRLRGSQGRRQRNKKGSKSDKLKYQEDNNNGDGTKNDDQLQSELELRSIKNELNLSDHTHIIKYEPNVQTINGNVEGSPIKMEEKHIQQQKVAEDNLLDIEDSIPTAFLVQKPNSAKNSYSTTPNQLLDNDNTSQDEQSELVDEMCATEKTENEVINELSLSKKDVKNDSTNNLEELKKMAESVLQPWETENNIQNETLKEETVEVKDETNDSEQAITILNTKMMEGRWFSILRNENPLVISESNTNDPINDKEGISMKLIDNMINSNSCYVGTVFSNNSHSCAEIVLTQGNKWDVINNIHLLKNPSSLLMSANGVQNQSSSITSFYHADSSLTMSGLDQEMLDASILEKHDQFEIENESFENSNKEENFENDDKDMDLLDESINKVKQKTNTVISNTNPNCNINVIPNYSNINLATLTAYVNCDSPTPIQMTPEESEQLEYCKINGLPKKIEGNYVPKDLRHGWWRITDPEQLKEVLGKLHLRGVREKELQNSFIASFQQTNNKIQIEKGDILTTELSISHLDRVIALNGGFPGPDSPDSFSLKTCRRIDMVLLDQVEALEDRVAAASMQIKGWKPGMLDSEALENPVGPDGEGAIAHARARILALEAAIERRYLRPPLGAGAPPAPAHAQTMTTVSSPVNNADITGTETPVDSRPSSPSHNYEPPTDSKVVGVPRGLTSWREAVIRSQTSAQLAMVLHALESAIAWDKSIMKANCQFCQSGDAEDKLLLCDGCDKGYHTYCFKPKMDKIPEGDWYCFECLNKATGEKVCIVCGGRMINSGGTMVPVAKGRLVSCTLCPRAYHQDCHYPQMHKFPRGKWYCQNCISKAPPKKPRNSKKNLKNANALDISDGAQPPSPAPSQASTATTVEDATMNMSFFCQSSLSSVQSTPEKHFQHHHNQYNNFSASDNLKIFSSIDNSTQNSPINNLHDSNGKNNGTENDYIDDSNYKNKDFLNSNESNLNEHNIDNSEDFDRLVDYDDKNHDHEQNNKNALNCINVENSSNIDGEVSYNMLEHDSASGNNGDDHNSKGIKYEEKDCNNTTERTSPLQERDSKPLSNNNKKDRSTVKRLNKELAPCKQLLEEMELHDDSWPFLLPVNTKQFPTYKKIIRSPMDFSTIRKKLQDLSYKTKEEFACDVRQIFHNCEIFNEDESPVGQAGHGMRRFFEERWSSV